MESKGLNKLGCLIILTIKLLQIFELKINMAKILLEPYFSILFYFVSLELEIRG